MEKLDFRDVHQTTRASLRKTTKPLLEKKRRARINSSLAQLKTLVLEAVKKDTARYSKLEKADVLDMTVRHLRALQSQQLAAAMASDPTVLSKFRAGFSECVGEVSRYLGTIDGLEPEVRMRLLEHLAACMERRVTHQITAPLPMTPTHMGVLQQPLHVQIPSAVAAQAAMLPGQAAMLPGQVVTSCATSSPPIGSLPPAAVHGVPVEAARPLMYGVPHSGLVTGALGMAPASTVHDRNTAHMCSVKHETLSPPHRERVVSMATLSSSSSPFVPETTVASKVIKQEPVWRPW